MKKLPLLVERSISEARVVRAQLAHEFQRNLRAERRTLTCRKGCHHCCYSPLMITVLEGIDLYRWLVKNHLWSHDRQEAFREHAQRTWGQSIEVWMLSMTPCPLLEDSVCLAYKKRPFACRIFVNQGDPHFCHPHRINEHDVILAPRKKWLEKLEVAERVILKRHKLAHVYVPLSTAILYGERVCKESIDITEVDIHLLGDFVKGGPS